MSIVFKCKMCGADLNILDGMTVVECDHCGTQQTLPRLDDDKRLNLYDRANHFRRANDYDKALAIYEQILAEDPQDAEAYWSIVLCRYGIEYVEDPATHKRAPTINRMQYTSIYADEDYKQALAHADGAQRAVYESEAAIIDEIQRGILAISQKEELFDVFICYKETDASGRRTQDSVLANDLYHQLTQEGFKVFFSRITLEDKLGTAYEPYIFAALNSAKVMVVLGTRPEFFNAVWVKNEWSRFLGLIKNGADKTLIPAYRDMDPYDLPEEFSHLQAQDMSKLGFMQDLIRGIKKITKNEGSEGKTSASNVHGSSSTNTDALIKRIRLFLEDGNFSQAASYCERVLDMDPECSDAYLYRLMSRLEARSTQELLTLFAKRQSQTDFSNSTLAQEGDYMKALRFANASRKMELQEIADQALANAKETHYVYLIQQIEICGDDVEKLESIAASFGPLIAVGYKDSSDRADWCRSQIVTIAKNKKYDKAADLEQKGDTKSLNEAATLFQQISDWKDSAIHSDECLRKIRLNEQRESAEADEKKAKAKKHASLAAIAAVAVVVIALLWVNVINPMMKYSSAETLYTIGHYDEAMAQFEQLGNYRDASQRVQQCKDAQIDSIYNQAKEAYDSGKYVEAVKLFGQVAGYKDSDALKEVSKETLYQPVTLLSLEPQTMIDALGTLGEIEENSSNGALYCCPNIPASLNKEDSCYLYYDAISQKSEWLTRSQITNGTPYYLRVQIYMHYPSGQIGSSEEDTNLFQDFLGLTNQLKEVKYSVNYDVITEGSGVRFHGLRVGSMESGGRSYWWIVDYGKSYYDGSGHIEFLVGEFGTKINDEASLLSLADKLDGITNDSNFDDYFESI